MLSFYKGMASALLGVIVSSGSYFFCYRLLKNVVLSRLKILENELNSKQIMLITALAGLTSSAFANPIWFMNTRMTLAKVKKSFVQTAIDIYKEEGLLAFYKGVLPNMILVLNPIINYVVYEAMKKRLTLNGLKQASVLKIFIASSLGKILATLVTYPILTMRVKLQKQAGENEEENQSQWKIFWKVFRQLSLLDYYAGIEAKIVQTVLYNAFLHIGYEKIRQAVKIIVMRIVRARKNKKLL